MTVNFPWYLHEPIDAVVFDCDGTLSSIEGINEIASQNGAYERVKALTETAMNTTGLNAHLYEQRLALVKPNQKQLIALGESYYKQQTPDAHEVIRALQQLGKKIYITSAGLYPAVLEFGLRLDIPTENIFAVPIFFDTNGAFSHYDDSSPFIDVNGKHQVVAEIKKRHPRIVYVGDGMNDVCVKDLVIRFVGYGGAYFRENIAAHSDFYIHTPSMTPLLPLCLTALEASTIEMGAPLLKQGLAAIENGKVLLSSQLPS